MTIKRTYTTVVIHECRDLYEQGEEVVIVCNDCGAFTHMGHELMVEHHSSCTPGEAVYWEKYYNRIDEEEYEEGDER